MSEQSNIGEAPVDQHIQQLLNSSIDGEINASDQAELDHLLATSQRVRDMDRELRAVSHLLDEIPEVEPPRYLQESIERQVRLPVQSAPILEEQGFLGGWLNANWLRTGLALAAGVVLTIGVYEMGSGPIPAEDVSNMTGTIASSGDSVSHEVLLDSVHLASEMFNGMVELRNKNDLYTLEFKLESDGPSEVVVNLAGRGLEFDGASREQGTMDAVSIVNETIHLASSGEQKYTLNLRKKQGAKQPATLELNFFANSKLVQQSELRVSQD